MEAMNNILLINGFSCALHTVCKVYVDKSQ